MLRWASAVAMGEPCPPPVSVYSEYVFGTLLNEKTTGNNGKRNTFKLNSRL